MNHSSRTSLATGRVNQKLRTRDTLVTVAAELLRRGKQFSVADVADRARVGRTTAYRYFPTLELLMAHAALWKIARLEQNEFDHVFDRPAARERVDALVVASDRSTRLHEKEYRAMLRMSLEHAPRSEQLLPLCVPPGSIDAGARTSTERTRSKKGRAACRRALHGGGDRGLNRNQRSRAPRARHGVGGQALGRWGVARSSVG